MYVCMYMFIHASRDVHSLSFCSLFHLLPYLLIRPDRLKALVGDKTCLSCILVKFKAIHSVGGSSVLSFITGENFRCTCAVLTSDDETALIKLNLPIFLVQP